MQSIDLAQLDEQLQPAHPRHHDVEDREIRGAAVLDECERLCAGACAQDLMSGLAKTEVDETAKVAVVVDNEDVGHRRRSAAPSGGRRERR